MGDLNTEHTIYKKLRKFKYILVVLITFNIWIDRGVDRTHTIHADSDQQKPAVYD